MSPQGKKTHYQGIDTEWQSLIRKFVSPENEADKDRLVDYMEQILFGLHDFLNKNVGVTEEISLKQLSDHFTDSRISFFPEKSMTDVITDIIECIAPHAVNVASPYFVGHMTSAIPYFMVLLKAIVAALNQNVVKLETSKVVSIVERQVTARVHRLIYDCPEDFYKKHIQGTDSTLGCFTEGGTAANMTALWVARNTALGPKPGFDGVEKEGLPAAYKAYDIDRCVVLVSRRGHYSLRKAGGILGIGNRNIIALDVDDNHRVCIPSLRKTIKTLLDGGRTKIIALIGVAGATETGAIDPLRRLGEICAEYGIYYHADAAWGGPTLMSDKYKRLLDGIALADSVTIDGHKQFYMPMTSGMVFFRNPFKLDAVSYHANYVIRRGSVDIGIKSIAGSREANSLILDSALKIMGKRGYAMLIDHGIETARQFADEIERRDAFQLTSKPELNILTYRFCPSRYLARLASEDIGERRKANTELNEINKTIQRVQRETGKSFVSRTVLKKNAPPGEEMVVLRSVLMNPMTTIKILNEVLDEQEDIYRSIIKDGEPGSI